jgi:hypothetical protein
MISKNFNDYNIADISKDDIPSITELERMLSAKANKDIVLIAYQPNDREASTKA